jgi:hypothetical protein
VPTFRARQCEALTAMMSDGLSRRQLWRAGRLVGMAVAGANPPPNDQTQLTAISPDRLGTCTTGWDSIAKPGSSETSHRTHSDADLRDGQA